MYSEWASLSSTIAANSADAQSSSVLNKFPASAGKEVAVSVVKQLASNLGITQNAEPSHLVKDDEVNWCMDVICFGLSLPLQEHETLKDCVNVYCEWLTALHPNPRISVPKPICDDPNLYCRKIINHFHNLFVPRQGESADKINRQAVLCHRVLRTLQQTAQISQIMNRETWEALLLFLLAINEILLAPPTVKDDVGDQLCERVLSVLFEVWLLACVRCFPSPSYWKTLQESCMLWRHRIALIEQWNRVNLVLTSRVIQFMYGPEFPELKISDEDAQLVPSGITNDCIAQTWYRFLRTIGNPTELCNPQVISKTTHFMQWAMSRDKGAEPYQHPCLLLLPQIFLKAMKGISSQVDAFLGIYQPLHSHDENITNLMDIRSSLSDAIHGSGSGSSHSSHHLFNFSSGSGAGGGGGSSSGKSSAADSGGGSSFLSGLSGTSATHALSSIIGHHHHHHHHHHSSSNSSSSSSYGTPMTSTTSSGLGSGAAGSGDHVPHSPTPPLQRRLAKSFSVAPSLTQQKGLSKAALIGLTSSRSSSTQPPLTPTSGSGPPSSSSLHSLPSIGSESRPPLAPTRPVINSILHLLGGWLFEAAYIGSESWLANTKQQASEASKRPSSVVMESRKGSLSMSKSKMDPSNIPRVLTIDKFESGRAEAIGTLCRIFCSKKTGEEILPCYYARFYMGLLQCMKIADLKECDETLASILLNSANLFRCDLDGIHCLLPAFVSALEVVLPEKDLKIKSNYAINYNKVELRRSSIHILLSLLALPLHFQTLQIQDLSVDEPERLMTFIQFKPRIINVLMSGLQVETDAQNTHMLLGGLLLTVQDAVNFEEKEMKEKDEELEPTPGPAATETNILSSDPERSASIASGASIHFGGGGPSLAATFGFGSGFSSAGGNLHTTGSTGKGSIGSSQHDYPSLSVSDDFPVELLQEFETASVYDNAHALFVRATYLVCHRLISSWKTDLNVSLAALELLSGLARLDIKDTDALECKRAVKWICDYICYQCSRPPPAHSKDLHSTIVSAFQCLSAWVMQHPDLLQDPDCFTTVIEVVELGISGSKSVGKPGEPPVYKDQKELKPVSMRVRDAADLLLVVIMEQVGYFPKDGMFSETISTLLDEMALVKFCESVDAKTVTTEMAIEKFKYFVTDNNTILALLEDPIGPQQSLPEPTLTVLFRTPFGRHAWHMTQQWLPRSSKSKNQTPVNPGRPVPMSDPPKPVVLPTKWWPDEVDQAPPCAADYSIPTLEQIREQYGTELMDKWDKIIEDQTALEKKCIEDTKKSGETLEDVPECKPPYPVYNNHTARQFLSQFGFISYDPEEETKDIPGFRQLIALDSERKNFVQDIIQLDKLSPRTHDTVHVFYVKSGQKTADEIIANMEPEHITTLNHHFGKMLLTLGHPVVVEKHCGWTGHVSTSWISSNNCEDEEDGEEELPHDMRFNGDKCVLYWADVSSEIAFVVPSEYNRPPSQKAKKPAVTKPTPTPPTEGSGLAHSASDKSVWNEKNVSVDSGISSTSVAATGAKPRTLSLELDGGKEPIPPTRRKNLTKPLLTPQPPAKVLVVWLESYEDYLNFPIDDLLCYTQTGEESQLPQPPKASDCHVIFLHALQTGLLRVKLLGSSGRMSFATPLIDGMVLSRRAAGDLIRQTAHNMAKRRRLDHDGFQPPHVRRRLKVTDIINKYKFDFKQYELVAHLFKGTV